MIDADKHFEHRENGTVLLNSEGKHLFLRMLTDKMETPVTVGKQSVSYNTIIDWEIKNLIRYFRKGEKRYNPFKQVR
jgi:CRISPR/Cas system-associated endonuclease Cas1